MDGLGTFLVVVAVGVAAFWQIWRDPRITRTILMRSLGWIAAYFLFGAIGIWIVLLIVRQPQFHDSAIPLTLFFLAWTMFGVLWLVRLAPMLKQPPAWLRRKWAVPDYILIAIIGGSLAFALLQ